MNVWTLVIAAIATLMFAVTPASAGLVVNGTFDDGCADWTTSQTDGFTCSSSEGNPGFAIVLNNFPGPVPQASQVISGLVTGQRYRITVDAKTHYNCCNNGSVPGAGVGIDGKQFDFLVTNNQPWTTYTFDFTYGGGSNTLVLSAQRNGTDSDAEFDNVDIIAVRPVDVSTGTLGALNQSGVTVVFDTDALTYSINGGAPIGGGRAITQAGTVTIAAFDFTTVHLDNVTVTATGARALAILGTGAVVINGTVTSNGADGLSSGVGGDGGVGAGGGGGGGEGSQVGSVHPGGAGGLGNGGQGRLGSSSTSAVSGGAAPGRSAGGNGEGGAGGGGAGPSPSFTSGGPGGGGGGGGNGGGSGGAWGNSGGFGGGDLIGSGGGGGHATAGANGTRANSGAYSGSIPSASLVTPGGSLYGTSALTVLAGGSGGGGGGDDSDQFNTTNGGGGGGGAIEIASSVSLSINGSISVRGGNGASGSAWAGGGGGSGGAVKLGAPSVTLTGMVNASGGSGGTASFSTGGNGGLGYIAIHADTSTNTSTMTGVTFLGGYTSSGVASDPVADFDAGFAAGLNPNGVWSYGWSSSLTSTLHLYPRHHNISPDCGYETWDDPANNVSFTPGIFKNVGGACFNGNVDIPAGAVDLHFGGAGGSAYSHIVYTAPADGTYAVSWTFTGHQVNVNSDVHILANGHSVLSELISADHQTKSYSAAVSLLAGQTIDFATGPGTSVSLHPGHVGIAGSIQRIVVPGTPTGLTATNTGGGVALTWTPHGGAASGFQIERRTVAGFVRIAVADGTATSFTDTRVTPQNVYTYRVRAVNGAGVSAYSNEAPVSLLTGKLVVRQRSLALNTTLGKPVTAQLQVRNDGRATLTGSVGSLSGALAVTANGGAFSIPAGGTLTVTVRFSPPARGTLIETLTITSQAPGDLPVAVTVTGTAR